MTDGFTLKLDSDIHTHTTFSDGSDTPADMVKMAEVRGIEQLGFADHVRRDSTWVPLYVSTVHHLRLHTDVELICSVEAKLLDESGVLDLPTRGLDGVDRILIADHRLPVAGELLSGSEAHRQIAVGELSVERAMESLFRSYLGSIRTASQFAFPPVLAHPFSILSKIGIDEAAIPRRWLDELARALVKSDAAFEINERWRCPSQATAQRLIDRGVRVVTGTDAHRAEDLGRFTYVGAVIQGISAPQHT